MTELTNTKIDNPLDSTTNNVLSENEYVSSENNKTNQPIESSTNLTDSVDFSSISPQELFNHFIDENFTDEQKAEIYSTMEKGLSQNNGSCKFVWKDANEEDSIKITYKNGEIKSFKIYDEDILSKDSYEEKTIHYSLKKTRAEFDLYMKSQYENMKLKTKENITLQNDGDFSYSYKDSYTTYTSEPCQFTYSIDAKKTTIEGENNKATEAQTKEKNTTFAVDIFGPSLKSKTQKSKYDGNGNINSQDRYGYNFDAGLGGIKFQGVYQKTIFDKDGATIFFSDYGAEYNYLSIKTNIGIGHAKANANNDITYGNYLSMGLAHGNNLDTKINLATLRTDDSGNKYTNQYNTRLNLDKRYRANLDIDFNRKKNGETVTDINFHADTNSHNFNASYSDYHLKTDSNGDEYTIQSNATVNVDYNSKSANFDSTRKFTKNERTLITTYFHADAKIHTGNLNYLNYHTQSGTTTDVDWQSGLNYNYIEHNDAPSPFDARLLNYQKYTTLEAIKSNHKETLNLLELAQKSGR